MSKHCPKCKEFKRLSEFYVDKSRKDGRTSWCKICRGKHAKQYHGTPDGKRRHTAHTKKYYEKKGGSKFRAERNLFRLYGVTPEHFDRLYVEQEGRCAICRKHQSEFKQALSVDHDHKTKVIRGLLCNNCNLAIGKFKDNPVFLRKAADYLE